MKANIQGIEVEGTAEEMDALFRLQGRTMLQPREAPTGGPICARAKGSKDCLDCKRTFKNAQGLKHHQTLIHGTARREISSAAGSSSASDIPTVDEPRTIKHYVFVCKVGPTEVRHPVDGTSPTTAIEAHDKANPNHRFVTALNKRGQSE